MAPTPALRELARAVGLLTGQPPAAGVIDRFSRYIETIRLWNRAQRLTGLESPVEIVRGLFVDSLLFLPLLPARPLRMLDIGAGAGIPGVPLRIVDEGISLMLVEARRKRVSFLRALGRELGLDDVAIIEGRAESVLVDRPELAGTFDVVVARAVGPVKRLLPSALQYLKRGGLFISSGPPAGSAMAELPEPARAELRSYAELGLKRVFVIAEKCA